MSDRQDNLIIDINIAGLYSDDSFTRELAIFQLQNHLDSEKVQLELASAMQREERPEIKFQIQSLLDLVKLENSLALTESDSSEHGPMPAEKLVKVWQAQKDFSAARFIEVLSGLDQQEWSGALLRVFNEERDLLRLIPFFSCNFSGLKNREILLKLAEMLDAELDVFVIRLLMFLSRNAPELVLKNIRRLLQHHNFYVKIHSLKLLFKFARPQALRLMHELVIKGSNKIAAVNMLFNFPFDDVRGIVVWLVENGALKQPELCRALENLVYNNPDLDFFEQLTRIEVLRGHEIPGLSQLKSVAAEGLIVAGLIRENKEKFSAQTRQKAADFIKQQSGIEIVGEEDQGAMMPVEPPSAEPQTADDAGAEPSCTEVETLAEKVEPVEAAGPADSNKPTESTETKIRTEPREQTALAEAAEPAESSESNEDLSALENKEAFVEADLDKIERLLADNSIEPLRLINLLKIVKSISAKMIAWLERQLSEASGENLILIMNLLAEKKYLRLEPHLPVLCLNSERIVSIQAIRLFRKHGRKRLLKLIEQWVKEDNEETWKAAMTALLQISIDEARMILLKVFLSTERVSLIKFFSPVFHISPDHHSLYELEKIFDKSRGPKRDALFDQIQLLKNALGLVKPSETAAISAESVKHGFKLQLDEIADSLEKFSYLADETELVEKLSGFLRRAWVPILAVLVLFVVAVYSFYNPSSQPAGGIEFTRVEQQIPNLEPGTVRFMTLEQYDPINMLWNAVGSDGTKFKLKLVKPERFAAGFRGNFKISAYRVSVSGYPVVSCELVQP